MFAGSSFAYVSICFFSLLYIILKNIFGFLTVDQIKQDPLILGPGTFLYNFFDILWINKYNSSNIFHLCCSVCNLDQVMSKLSAFSLGCR